MSFYTGCITSFFPDSYSMHSDESSSGYRFYNSFSTILENIYYENFILSRYATFSNDVSQLKSLFGFKLEQKDFGEIDYSYDPWPVVFANGVRLKSFDNFVDFMYAPPNLFVLENKKEINSWLIWDSTQPDIFNDINEADILTIDLTQIDELFPRNADPKSIDRVKREFQSNYVVSLKGYDEAFNFIEEDIFVAAKEVFKTKYRYRILDFVDFDGIDGDFKIYLTEKNQINKSFVSETDFANFADSRRFVKYDLIHDQTYSYIRNHLVANRYPSSRILTDSERFIFLVDRPLLDEDGNSVKALDYFRDPRNKLFYILSTNNTLYCYDMKLNIIEDLSLKVSENTYVRFDSNISRCTLNEELEIGVLFKSRVGSPENYSFCRVDPDGIKSWWDGLKWVNTPYVFNLDMTLWKNSRVVAPTCISSFNKFGKWEFYFEINFEDFQESQIIGKAIYCEFLKPLKKFSIDSKFLLDGIFSNKDRGISVSSGNLIFSLKEIYDVYSYSPITNEVLFRTFIEEVEVIMPFYVGLKKEGRKNCFYINSQKTDIVNLKGGERHILNQDVFKCTHSLYFSNSRDQKEAIFNKKNVIYLVDRKEVNYNLYKQLLSSENFDTVEILFDLESGESLYCFSEEDDKLCLKINSMEDDVFIRVGENYGNI